MEESICTTKVEWSTSEHENSNPITMASTRIYDCKYKYIIEDHKYYLVQIICEKNYHMANINTKHLH